MAGSRLIDYLLTSDPRADKKALRLYRKALQRAQRRLEANRKPETVGPVSLGADEVAPELERLLRNAYHSVNCLDKAAYQRLHQVILNWQPATAKPRQQMACALVQTVLLSLLPQYQKKQRLEQLCAQYQDHLAQAALAELKEQAHHSKSLVLSMNSQLSIQTSAANSHACLASETASVSMIASDALRRIQEKQASVNRLRAVWATRQNLSVQCQQFQTIFQQERRVLEKDRDSAAMTFVKAIATVLTVGLAALLGIWSVKGRKITEQIEQVLYTPGPSIH